MRTLVVILNFIFTPNLSYRQITSLRQVLVGRRDGLGSLRRHESVGFSRSEFALARHVFRGCHEHRLAAETGSVRYSSVVHDL